MILVPEGPAATTYNRTLAAEMGVAPGARIWQRRYMTEDGQRVVVNLACVGSGSDTATVLILLPDNTTARTSVTAPPLGGIRRAMTEALTKLGHTVLEPVGSKMGERGGDRRE